MSEVSKHGAELGAMNAELIKALQANREERRQEREAGSINSTELPTTRYLSQCECGQEVEGEGQYDPADGTLYGQECPACGEDFTVQGWYEECDFCGEYHDKGELC